MTKTRRWAMPIVVLVLGGALCKILISVAESQDLYRIDFNLYSDNRKVTVSGPALALHKDLTDQTSLTLRYKVDAVSSASISCSVCHKEREGWSRNEIVLGGEHTFGNTTLGANYYNSREMDYASDALTFSASQNFRQDNTTLSIRYSRSWDRPKPHGWKDLLEEIEGSSEKEEKDDDDDGDDQKVFSDFVFSPEQVLPQNVPDADVHTVFLGWTQVLSGRTIAQLNYEFSTIEGYQSSPYHIIPINGTDYLETHPESRRRNAFSTRLKHSLTPSSTVGLDYRFYTDNWSVHSNTVGVQVFQYLLSKDLLLRLHYRYYTQSKADFFRRRYEALNRFITNDARLQSFNTNLYGVNLSQLNLRRLTTLPLLEHLRMDLEYEHYTGNPSSIGMTTSGRRIRGSSSDLNSNIFRLGLSTSF